MPFNLENQGLEETVESHTKACGDPSLLRPPDRLLGSHGFDSRDANRVRPSDVAERGVPITFLDYFRPSAARSLAAILQAVTDVVDTSRHTDEAHARWKEAASLS